MVIGLHIDKICLTTDETDDGLGAKEVTLRGGKTYNPKVQQTSHRIAANLEIFRSRA